VERVSGFVLWPVLVGYLEILGEGILMIKATTTCDACGKRYEFTSHKDMCPVCCPEQARDDNSSEDDFWPDEEYGDDD